MGAVLVSLSGQTFSIPEVKICTMEPIVKYQQKRSLKL